ncbi:MAG: hypothetical protein M3541_05295 [Acidobacteriota bacterium]|nr:hypothetical protein [Acidobacteriota bacterium]
MQILDDQESVRVATETKEVFTLRKGDGVAVCTLTSHASQHETTWELQLFVGTSDNELMATYCDSQGEVFSLSEKWNTKLLANGWTNGCRENSGGSCEATREPRTA